ncbi:hypothetical protein BpHYR1_045792 [Brachionus plicatilis]|uniref:Uncharacterized protein n=1 Tax=Brachionus plicatilis TaxID=10195 RepID=A0A3M7P6G1_BRAPC|nr:hypothetical protein BpHYR1_045792 [Brachionus plicatilis]
MHSLFLLTGNKKVCFYLKKLKGKLFILYSLKKYQLKQETNSTFSKSSTRRTSEYLALRDIQSTDDFSKFSNF